MRRGYPRNVPMIQGVIRSENPRPLRSNLNSNGSIIHSGVFGRQGFKSVIGKFVPHVWGFSYEP